MQTNPERYATALRVYADAEVWIAHHREQLAMYEKRQRQAARTIEALRPQREAA